MTVAQTDWIYCRLLYFMQKSRIFIGQKAFDIFNDFLQAPPLISNGWYFVLATGDISSQQRQYHLLAPMFAEEWKISHSDAELYQSTLILHSDTELSRNTLKGSRFYSVRLNFFHDYNYYIFRQNLPKLLHCRHQMHIIFFSTEIESYSPMILHL